LLRQIRDGDRSLSVPDLWVYEMANLLLSARRRRRITEEQLLAAHRLLDGVPHRLYDHEDRLARERVSRLAMRFRLSAYDAAYLELADRLQCALVTADDRLGRAGRALGLSTS